MSLRELKKEAQELPDISKNLKNFQNNWVKQIKNNSKDFSEEDQIELNQNFLQTKKLMNELQYSQNINTKLSLYSSHLIDLKLTTLNGDQEKSKLITNLLLNDDFLKFRDTISEVKSFQKKINRLTNNYHHINKLLQQRLKLDEYLTFMDLPHKKHLYNLKKTSKQHQKLVHNLGQEFVSLVKETQLKTKHKK